MDSKSKAGFVIDKPLAKGSKVVSLSVFSFIFSELVQYCQSRSVSELEARLSSIGQHVGMRVLELVTYREKNCKRETNIIAMLQLIHGNIWKSLFGKVADRLERSTTNSNEYYIYDANPITNKYISVPKNLSGLNCAAFVAGIIQGILHSAEFPAEVTAAVQENDSTMKTVYVIQFERSVTERQVE